MAKELVISVRSKWIEEQGDCRTCYGCEDMIVGKMYSLGFEINGQGEMPETVISICQNCMDVVNESA